MSKNKRMIYTEHLPRYEEGLRKGKIDWGKTIGCTIPFKYREIEGVLIILKYFSRIELNRNRFFLLVQYEKNEPVELNIDNISRCRLGSVLPEIPWKFKRGDEINDLVILSQSHLYLSSGSYRSYDYKCKDCGYIGKAYAHEVSNKRCPKCGDGISFGEKFVYAILVQLGIDFETHHVYEWSKGGKRGKGKKIYDFSIPSIDGIIEVHGIQHYPDEGSDFSHIKGISAKDECKNDELKKELALRNGIKSDNYIVIDSRVSDHRYLCNSILSNEKFNNHFKGYNLNDEFIMNFVNTNFRKEAIKLYQDGFTLKEISKQTKMAYRTICKFLKHNAKIFDIAYTCDKNRTLNEQRESVLNLFVEGLSRKEISKELNVCYTSVNKILKGYKDENKCFYQTQEERSYEKLKLAVDYYKKDIQEKEIAKILGCDTTTVVKYLIKAKELGVYKEYRTKAERVKQYIIDSASLYEQGKSPREIEDILGLSKDRSYIYLMEADKLGLCHYKRPKELEYEKIKQICDLFNKGRRVMQICTELNIDKGTVRRYLIRGNAEGECIYPR